MKEAPFPRWEGVREGSKGSSVGVVFEVRFDHSEKKDTLVSIVRPVSFNLRFRNNMAGSTGTNRRARFVRAVGTGKTTMLSENEPKEKH